MKALVTRPAEDAASLAAALAARGLEPLLEPLLSIRFAEDGPARLAPLLPGVQALLFTSANGVRAYERAATSDDFPPARHSREGGNPSSGLDPRLRGNDDIGAQGGSPATEEQGSLPVFTVGDATAHAARAAGFADVTSAGGNVEDLARLVIARTAPGNGALLHIAASAVAGDLAGRLSGAGFELRRAVLYDAVPASSLSAATCRALARGDIGYALFFSPRTAATFARLARAADLSGTCRTVTALALSPAVAAALADLPWRRVAVAETPHEPALLAMLDEVRNAPATSRHRRDDGRKAAR